MITRVHALGAALLLAIAGGSPAGRAVPASAPRPPMGWNSFDGYGVYLTEEAARANLEAMAVKLKPHGYEYFVIDNGWAGEYALRPGTRYPREKHAARLHLNAFGYFEPSHVYFPGGFAPLIRRCHELGLKFGVHLMRGIPRQAVEGNLPVEGTPYHARDIADTHPAHQCTWCPYNYGVEMDKPGAQAWYDGLVRHLAAQGIDFIKYDDIVPYPREVEAVAEAIRKVPQPIVLSLSPGGRVAPGALPSFRRANALRVTNDIWDDQAGIDRCFAAWRKWAGKSAPGFWIDMDMIPFGELQVMNPPTPAGAAASAALVALAGKGTHRRSQLSPDQMTTFITLRALAASPLMLGGNLESIDAFSLRLVTDADVIACNQNGVMGHLVSEADGIEVWSAPRRDDPARGWIGVFNRTARDREAVLTPELLQVPPQAQVTDIWNGRRALAVGAPGGVKARVPAQGAIFLRVE